MKWSFGSLFVAYLIYCVWKGDDDYSVPAQPTPLNQDYDANEGSIFNLFDNFA